MNILLHSYAEHEFEDLDRIGRLGFAAILRVSKGKPTHVENRFDTEWRRVYDQRSYFLRDPLIAWALTHDGCIGWDDPSVVDPFGVIGEARAHGMRYGMTVATGSAETRSFCGLARADRDFTESERLAALAAIERLHGGPIGQVVLTEAQREALQLMAAGERHARAAARIGISESALKARLKSARLSLAARTTAEAVHAAQARGLI
ncbi:autoinducer binding domain-containing protein [Limimaricola pyoseonensis]|uniref:LuxR family transcriptional regulator n=1 Tax=Limimaricola pyoseonensis TaxID=521013 RepID=A0A1G7J5P9_9RHOB|nr:autoinducer binding domain-containing protein [Limimaricola pyoseonensis]SDF19829.1 LuxR family transcriptional regulator [Limimaricola pyoseonensis]